MIGVEFMGRLPMRGGCSPATVYNNSNGLDRSRIITNIILYYNVIKGEDLLLSFMLVRYLGPFLVLFATLVPRKLPGATKSGVIALEAILRPLIFI